MNLPVGFPSGPKALQLAFKKYRLVWCEFLLFSIFRYLLPIDDLSRKLGTTLDELPISWPRKSKTAAAVESPKTGATPTASGSAQTSKAVTKSDDSKKEGGGQRRGSVAKSDKSLKVRQINLF